MSGKGKRKRRLLEPRTITLPGNDYQPGKAEMEREYDMPGASMRTIRRAFFRPLKIKRDPPK